MVGEELINNLPLGEQISLLTKTLQALGGIISLYIIFGVINILINRKKKKQLKSISSKLDKIEKILKNKK